MEILILQIVTKQNIMRAFFLLITLSLTNIACSQTNYNELILSEYESIKFNGFPLSEFLEFEGDISTLSSAINVELQDITHPQDDEGKAYTSNEIFINFFENNLGAIEVKTRDVVVNINDIGIRIGDDIANLNIDMSEMNSFANPNDSNKRIAIFKPYNNDGYISFEYNTITRIIESIRYTSPT